MPMQRPPRGTRGGESYSPTLHASPTSLAKAPAFSSEQHWAHEKEGISWLSLRRGVPMRCQLKSLSGEQGDLGGSLKGATPLCLPHPAPFFQPSLGLGSGWQARNQTASLGGTSRPGPPPEAPQGGPEPPLRERKDGDEEDRFGLSDWGTFHGHPQELAAHYPHYYYHPHYRHHDRTKPAPGLPFTARAPPQVPPRDILASRPPSSPPRSLFLPFMFAVSTTPSSPQHPPPHRLLSPLSFLFILSQLATNLFPYKAAAIFVLGHYLWQRGPRGAAGQTITG